MKKMLEDILKIDTLIYLRIHKLNQNNFLHIIMKYLTHLGTNFFGFVYGGLIIGLYYYKSYEKIDRLLVSIIISQTIVYILKRLVNRPRPYKTMVLKTVKRPPNCLYSFPSAHTSVAFATSLGGCVLFPSFTPLFLVLAVGIGLSRIILGYHYPLDVLMGGLISYVVHTLAMIY